MTSSANPAWSSFARTRRMLASAGALVLCGLGGLAGCSGNDESDAGAGPTNEGPSAFLPLYASGSRLRAITVGEPGSSTRRFVTWYDSELDTECSFLSAEDGRLRCLPLPQSLATGFADGACTETIFYDTLVEPCATHPPYRHETVESEGCSGMRVIRMQQEALDSVYHEACGEEAVELTEGVTVWSDAETIDPSGFVAGERIERLNAAGFGVIEIHGEDGSRQTTNILDEEHGTCAPRTLAGGDERCVPNAAYVENWWYEDPACEGEPLAYAIPPNTCGQSQDIRLGLDVTDRNYDGATLVRVGPPVEGTVYEDSFSTDMCETREAEEALWSLHRVEGPFDAEELHATSRITSGDGRIQTYHNAVDDVMLTYAAGTGLFDSELDAACTATRTSDGGWLCLPEGTSAIDELSFADPECSEPVAYTLARDVRFLTHVERNFCVRGGSADVVLESYDAVESYTGPIYLRSQAGDCELLEPEVGEGYWTMRPIEFAELEELQE